MDNIVDQCSNKQALLGDRLLQHRQGYMYKKEFTTKKKKVKGNRVKRLSVQHAHECVSRTLQEAKIRHVLRTQGTDVVRICCRTIRQLQTINAILKELIHHMYIQEIGMPLDYAYKMKQLVLFIKPFDVTCSKKIESKFRNSGLNFHITVFDVDNGYAYVQQEQSKRIVENAKTNTLVVKTNNVMLEPKPIGETAQDETTIEYVSPGSKFIRETIKIDAVFGILKLRKQLDVGSDGVVLGAKLSHTDFMMLACVRPQQPLRKNWENDNMFKYICEICIGNMNCTFENNIVQNHFGLPGSEINVEQMRTIRKYGKWSSPEEAKIQLVADLLHFYSLIEFNEENAPYIYQIQKIRQEKQENQNLFWEVIKSFLHLLLGLLTGIRLYTKDSEPDYYSDI